jgi:hypothetical protein
LQILERRLICGAIFDQAYSVSVGVTCRVFFSRNMFHRVFMLFSRDDSGFLFVKKPSTVLFAVPEGEGGVHFK